MEKTITDLSVDYFEAACNIDSMIKNITAKIRSAAVNGETDKCYRLQQKRKDFYSQKREIMSIAYKLANYYKKEEKAA